MQVIASNCEHVANTNVEKMLRIFSKRSSEHFYFKVKKINWIKKRGRISKNGPLFISVCGQRPNVKTAN